jgi:hypothetical protein
MNNSQGATMTVKRAISGSLTAVSVIIWLAAWAAVFAASSTARAETANQIVMSASNVDCPACQVLKSYNQDGLSFRDVVAEQNGDQIVITAQIAMAATAGKPRTGSVVFSAFMDYTDDVGFTDDACTPSQLSRQAADQACAAISRALHDTTTAPSPLITGPSAPTEGIIMRDGGVCDPIRHMGC